MDKFSYESRIKKIIKKRLEGSSGQKIRNSFIEAVKYDLETLILICGDMSNSEAQMIINKKIKLGNSYAANFFLNHRMNNKKSSISLLNALDSLGHSCQSYYLCPDYYEKETSQPNVLWRVLLVFMSMWIFYILFMR